MPRAHEPPALAAKGPDQALLRPGIPDCGARRVQPAAERCLGDDAAVPYGIQQVIAADDPVPHFDQQFQHVEDLRLDRDEAVAPTKLAPGRIEGAVFELVNHEMPDAGDWI